MGSTGLPSNSDAETQPPLPEVVSGFVDTFLKEVIKAGGRGISS